MDIRSAGDWALVGALAIGITYAVRDIRRQGWRKATFVGSSTPTGSLEDTLGKAASVGLALFLLTRLVPATPAG